jgi:hypothetical protein
MQAAAVNQAADTGPLVYHSGGKVMISPQTYAIFWMPTKLQNGAATGVSSHYKSEVTTFLSDYPGHGIGNNSTQYYQVINSATTWVRNSGSYGGSYTDTTSYPASGCSDSATPGNCITDAQIQAEIKKVMSLKGWTAASNKMFLLFTSSGEGSCFSAGSTSCAYTKYCAYHGYFLNSTGVPVIYGNEPYAGKSGCEVQHAVPPYNDIAADSAANLASHELTEAITDPLLNAWYSSQGNEIGDLCAWNFGVESWDSSLANQMWNGHFYLLQQEFDNHVNACALIGP